MPNPTITSKVTDASGRTLVTLSDGTQFYVSAVSLLGRGPQVNLSSPPGTLTGNAETVLTFTNPVQTVNVQNNSSTDKWINFDATASNGVLRRVPSGQLYSEEIQCSAVHIWSTAADALNTSAVGVAVWGNA